MGLIHEDIAFLNFDNCYLDQEQLWRERPHHWIDLQEIRHTNLFCESSSFKQIEQKLQHHSPTGITLIGSGNYHYVSYALLSRIQEPFTLVLIDHHSDLTESSAPAMLSCGSWVYHAILHLPHLVQTIIIGPDASNLPALPAGKKNTLQIMPNEHPKHNDIKQILTQIKTKNVYISIDKDVLDPSIVMTNWDQGHMILSDLVPLITAIIRQKHVQGVDICGEWKGGPSDIFNPENRQAAKKNEAANHYIINAVLNATA
ncbi:arginase family protein [Scopulibacillus darangshiensis]|uniref:Arginase family protein n=1 Tax=Scopulibacillus darangshiensis TaxID=442528 RepID=A0A4R2NRF3_9BACL|nr:arginase family protein [Scopulibacillus darangshiensis]TCP24509.1 arginase family protein [Scopulibacillus darangshiensis]